MKGNRQTLDAKMIQLQRRILWKREDGRCWVCSRAATEVMHIVGRRFENVKYDVDNDGNCHLGCRHCHEESHRGRISLEGIYDTKFGFGTSMILRRRANAMVQGLKSHRLQTHYDELRMVAEREMAL